METVKLKMYVISMSAYFYDRYKNGACFFFFELLQLFVQNVTSV